VRESAYYNGIPFTASGSTRSTCSTPAIIGRVAGRPAGSVCRAGTGGVALFDTPEVAAAPPQAGATVAADGLRRTVTVETGSATTAACARPVRLPIRIGYRECASGAIAGLDICPWLRPTTLAA
jgi:iron complex outermembrane receptor protein